MEAVTWATAEQHAGWHVPHGTCSGRLTAGGRWAVVVRLTRLFRLLGYSARLCFVTWRLVFLSRRHMCILTGISEFYICQFPVRHLEFAMMNRISLDKSCHITYLCPIGQDAFCEIWIFSRCYLGNMQFTNLVEILKIFQTLRRKVAPVNASVNFEDSLKLLIALILPSTKLTEYLRLFCNKDCIR